MAEVKEFAKVGEQHVVAALHSYEVEPAELMEKISFSNVARKKVGIEIHSSATTVTV